MKMSIEQFRRKPKEAVSALLSGETIVLTLNKVQFAYVRAFNPEVPKVEVTPEKVEVVQKMLASAGGPPPLTAQPSPQPVPSSSPEEFRKTWTPPPSVVAVSSAPAVPLPSSEAFGAVMEALQSPSSLNEYQKAALEPGSSMAEIPQDVLAAPLVAKRGRQRPAMRPPGSPPVDVAVPHVPTSSEPAPVKLFPWDTNAPKGK